MRATALLVLIGLSGSGVLAQEITGELRQWHDVILTFEGPETSEDAEPNPFLHYRLDVIFEKYGRSVTVPGYFAADGNAAETSATGGDRWRVHFVPDETGPWTWRVSLRRGHEVAVDPDPQAGEAAAPDGLTGTLEIAPSDKVGRDHRAHGTLRYVGERYARYQGSGEYFIQVGAQSPENFLAYAGFDGTIDHGGAPNRLKDGLHHYEPHVRDWRRGDPTWKGGRGKGILDDEDYWHDRVRKNSIWGTSWREDPARSSSSSATLIRTATWTWRTGAPGTTSGTSSATPTSSSPASCPLPR